MTKRNRWSAPWATSRPEGPGTPQADLYSLGKVLYEIAIGKDRQEFPQLPPDLQSHPDYAALLELNEIILKACETDPRQRYACATALREDLELLQRGQSVRSVKSLGVFKRAGIGLVVVAALAASIAILSREMAQHDLPIQMARLRRTRSLNMHCTKRPAHHSRR